MKRRIIFKTGKNEAEEVGWWGQLSESFVVRWKSDNDDGADCLWGAKWNASETLTLVMLASGAGIINSNTVLLFPRILHAFRDIYQTRVDLDFTSDGG